MVKTDYGSESISKVMDNYERRVAIDFSRPGNPTDNACVQSFNGRLRECLNANFDWLIRFGKRLCAPSSGRCRTS